MKKLLLLLAAILTTLAASAQIPTNFFGCTLGESTKSQIVSSLNNRCIDYEIVDGAYLFENYVFDNISWEGVALVPYNNTLMRVAFMTEGNPKETYLQLKQKFDSKYEQYSIEKNWYINVIEQCTFSDGTTRLELFYDKNTCVIYFTNIYLENQDENDGGEDHF